MTLTKGDQVREYLVQNYPCAVLPLGVLTEVGERFGLSRERVRQIAAGMGYPGYSSLPSDQRVIRGRMGRRLCPSCGTAFITKRRRYANDFIGKQRCPSCQWIDVACEACGKLKRVKESEYLSRTSNPKNSYTGRVFCDRVCFGRWIAKTVGFAAHPENAAMGARTATAHRNEKLEVAISDEPATIADLMVATGMGEAAVRRGMARLVSAGKARESRKATTGRALVWTW